MNKTESPFVAELKANIRAKITELKRSGTVGMSVANLRQVTRTPRATEGAPVGNPVGNYIQIFHAAVMEMQPFRGFEIR